MIYFSQCKIKQPHDFPDHPCKKCNAPIIITKDEVIISGKVMKTLQVVLLATAIALIALVFILKIYE